MIESLLCKLGLHDYEVITDTTEAHIRLGVLGESYRSDWLGHRLQDRICLSCHHADMAATNYANKLRERSDKLRNARKATGF